MSGCGSKSSERVEHNAARALSALPNQGADAKKKRSSKSMHEGVAVWCDCCSCEAEPYWRAVADELGIDLGSDYEDIDD